MEIIFEMRKIRQRFVVGVIVLEYDTGRIE